MLIDWQETSWGSKDKWIKDASDWGCPILEEYGQEPPQDEKKKRWILNSHCRNGRCELYSEPFDAWECCPYGQQMAEEVLELLQI